MTSANSPYKLWLPRVKSFSGQLCQQSTLAVVESGAELRSEKAGSPEALMGRKGLKGDPV